MKVCLLFCVTMLFVCCRATHKVNYKKDIVYEVFDSLENYFAEDIAKQGQQPVGVIIDPYCRNCKDLFINEHQLFGIALVYKFNWTLNEIFTRPRAGRYLRIKDKFYPIYFLWIDNVFANTYGYVYAKGAPSEYGMPYPEIGLPHFIYVDASAKLFFDNGLRRGKVTPTYHVSRNDSHIIDANRLHPEANVAFNNKPTEFGKYIVSDHSRDILHNKVWGIFSINTRGRLSKLIDSINYCCYQEEIDLADKNRIMQPAPCSERDVFILNEVITYGYGFEDLDSMRITPLYKNRKDDVWGVKVNARILPLYNGDSMFRSILVKHTDLRCSYDFEFALKNRDTFRITDIMTAMYKSKDTAIGNFCTMYSYKINGKKVNSNYITLVRPGFEKGYEEYQRK